MRRKPLMSGIGDYEGARSLWENEETLLKYLAKLKELMEPKTKEQLTKEIDALKQQLKPLEEELHSLYEAEGEEVEAKIKRCQLMKDKFSPDELRYAATSRCTCGAGLAYPKNISPRGSWYCSAILTGQAKRGSTHDSSFPFAFYEIKSEEQPSANGQTTRPE